VHTSDLSVVNCDPTAITHVTQTLTHGAAHTRLFLGTGVITEVSNKQFHIERRQMAIEDFDKRHEDGGPRKSFLEGRESSKFGGYCISYYPEEHVSTKRSRLCPISFQSMTHQSTACVQ
jgi:hypothetical protein